MIPGRLEEIHTARLLELVSAKPPESQTLEFKRELPNSTDRGRYEFLKDVCALANTDGGDLVFGVADDCSIVPIIGEAPDAAQRRLGQILDSALEPRLVGHRFHPVPIAAGGYVLVLRIPASFNRPHRYQVNNSHRFVVRSGTHIVDMTYDQLRAAFDRTASLAERARRFRLERIDKISRGETWRPLIPGPQCVLHVLPLVALGGRTQLDINVLFGTWTGLMFPEWNGGNRSTNLDGLIAYPSGGYDRGLVAYVQVFRQGAIEAVRFGGVLIEEKPLIPSTLISSFFRTGIANMRRELVRLGVSGPAIVAGAFLHVKGYQFAISNRYYRWEQSTADRPHLLLPETWVDELRDFGSVDDIARPMLDVLWQAFGIERCLEYDEATGNWAPG